MKFKGTFVLFLAFLVLGGYVYFTEFRGKEERQKQEEAKKRLFTGEASEVTEMTLEYEGRVLTAVRKGEKDWAIASPAGLEADSEAWEQLASGFVKIEKDEVVSSQKTILTQYGLEPPVVKVTAKLKNGSMPGVLFGMENPRKTFNYAKRTDSDEVFLSPTTWGNSFKKSLTDLRYKKVLDFESENIDSFRIAVAGKPEVEFQKSGMDWTIKQPAAIAGARADVGEISGFLSSIQFSRTAAFAEDKVEAKTTGLDAPAVRITLHDQKAKVDKVLLFGKVSEKEKYFAKDQSREPVFILGMEILQKAQQPLFGWRDKSIVPLGAAGSLDVDELEITKGSDKVVLKKAGMDWQLDNGKDVGKKTMPGKVEGMIAALENGRASQIVDAPGGLGTYGLDKPRLTVAVRKSGKNVEAIAFGRENATPAGVYIKASSGPVMTVGRELYDAFDVKMSDLVEAPPSPTAPSK